MRFLANENLPRSAVEALCAEGHNVAWVRAQAPGATDEFLSFGSTNITLCGTSASEPQPPVHSRVEPRPALARIGGACASIPLRSWLLKVPRCEPSLLGDAGEHARADLLAIVEGPNVVSPPVALERGVGAAPALFPPPDAHERREYARRSRGWPGAHVSGALRSDSRES